MSHTLKSITGGAVIAIIILAVYASGISAHADTRGSTSSREAARTTVSDAPSVPASTPVVTTTSGGSIFSSASGEVSSGGNTGGTVTTGDQQTSVSVVNIVPANTVVTVTSGNGQQATPPSTAAQCNDPRTDACADRGR